MNPILIGTALAVGARLAAKHVTLPPTTVGAIRNTLDALDDISAVVGHVNLQRPDTWLEFGERLIRRAITNEGGATTSDRWLESRGYTYSEARMPAIWNDLIRRTEVSVAYRDPHDSVWRADLGAEHFYISVNRGSHPRHPNTDFDNRNFLLPSDGLRRRQVLNAMASVFWAGRSSVTLDNLGDEFRLTSITPGTTPFIGPEVELFDSWRAFNQAGLRRCVLLQGSPGCGKSTFARAAARSLSTRTVFVTGRAFDNINETDWAFVLDALQPEMIVVDDIDRVRYLDAKLPMFEESRCQVAYIILTSNSLDAIPLAMRRPGRVDQIIEFDDPSEPVLLRLIHDLAKMAQVNVDPSQIPAFKKIIQEYSPAHLLEFFRRASVEGWDREHDSDDITFGAGYAEEDKDDTAYTDPRAHFALSRRWGI